MRRNYTATSRYFAKAKPVSTEYDLCPVRRPGGRLIPRLAFSEPFHKKQWSCDGLARFLAEVSNPHLIVFPDTSFFVKEMDQPVWDSLCMRSIALAPSVVSELQGWLHNPCHNGWFAEIVAKAIEVQEDQKTIQALNLLRTSCQYLDRLDWQPYCFSIPPLGPFHECGFTHYRDLLLARKLVGKKVADELRLRLGREPTEEEVRRELRPLVGERGERLAIKGWRDFGKRNYAADEDLVVMAVLGAILTGRDTLILTWDTDLQEQFTKLLTTISADYHAYLVGESLAYHRTPRQKMPVPPGRKGEVPITDDVTECVGISADEVLRFRPSRFHPAVCACCLLGNHKDDLRVTYAEFCAEREMISLLKMKYRTGGRNTDSFGERNIRIGTMPEGTINTFWFVTDRFVDFMGLRLRGLDLEAVHRNQQPVIKKLLWVDHQMVARP